MKMTRLKLALLLATNLCYAGLAAADSTASTTITSNISSNTGAASPTITDSVTFYLPSGNLSATPTCPNGTTPTTTVMNSGALYDGNLNSVPSYAGYTCSVSFTSFQTKAQAFAAAKIPTSSAAATDCSVSSISAASQQILGGAPPANMYCYEGTISAINTATANTSVCYSESGFPVCSRATCCASVIGIRGGSCNGSNPGGMYYAYNGTVSSGVYLTSGAKNVLLPNCGSGKLYMALSSNASLNFTFTKSITFEQSYQGNCPTVSCTSTGSPNGNSPANGSCTASGITITSGYLNTINIGPGTPTTFLHASGSSPFNWITNPVCVISGPTTTTPI